MTGAAAATVYRERMRDAVAAALLAGFADEPGFIGLVEGGSAATGRLDEHSDIDFGVIAEPALNDRVFACVERAAAVIDRIVQICPAIDAGWPGLTQKFYLFGGAPPFFMLDVWVAPKSAALPFLEPERHGHAVFMFNRDDQIRPPALDAAVHRARMIRRRAHIKSMWPVMRKTLDKDLARGRWPGTHLRNRSGPRCDEKGVDARRRPKDSSSAYGRGRQHGRRALLVATLRGRP